MFFKLSRKNENKEFCCQLIDDASNFTWNDHHDLKKIFLKTFSSDQKKEEVQYFQDLSSKIKNQDFDEVISRWMRQNSS